MKKCCNKKKPNLLFFGIDSLRKDHMSLHGYSRLTTPNISKYLEDGIIFDNCFSPSIPTTPGYASMITGMDCFSTNVVALRHEGQMADNLKTLPELLAEQGYNTTCVGFSGNAGSRGYQKYIDFTGWGSWDEGRSRKAENLNDVTLPELERLAKEEAPFMLFLRHMDPHSPYLPPEPFDKMFYQGNQFDENNKSLDAVYDFKPFRDYFCSWFPPNCTDSDYIVAQYDSAIAYMDACIQVILQKLVDLGIDEDTVVVFTSDHGETLNDHECYFDHHGLYDCTLVVPFAIKYKGNLEGGKRISEFCYMQDVMPTILDAMGIETDIDFDGRNMLGFIRGENIDSQSEFYITEATWMRKHGWRTPKWKLIMALEPDFHYKEEIELYDLENDPQEFINMATQRPDIVEKLKAKLLAHVEKREKEVGRTAPIYTNTNWNGFGRPFASSEEAYTTLHIGDPESAKRLQEKKK